MSRQGLTPVEAAQAIVADALPLPAESVPIEDALDRVLAEPVGSTIDIPAWDNSAMDGYAVRTADLAGAAAGVALRVIESVAAGAFPTRPIGPGECTRIFTGAPLPQGSDGVIRQEDTTALPGAQVRIDDTRDAGRNVRYRGEDIRRGEVVFDTGTALEPAHIGVLASFARAHVSVRRRPVVAILGSGDEIADLDEADAIIAGKKIASSNSYTLRSEERRVGKECPSKCRSRWSPYH